MFKTYDFKTILSVFFCMKIAILVHNCWKVVKINYWFDSNLRTSNCHHFQICFYIVFKNRFSGWRFTPFFDFKRVKMEKKLYKLLKECFLFLWLLSKAESYFRKFNTNKKSFSVWKISVKLRIIYGRCHRLRLEEFQLTENTFKIRFDESSCQRRKKKKKWLISLKCVKADKIVKFQVFYLTQQWWIFYLSWNLCKKVFILNFWYLKTPCQHRNYGKQKI